MGREQQCPVLLGSAGSCLLYLALKCQDLPGSARLCLGPAGPAHDSELVHCGGAGQRDCMAGVAI